MRRGSGVGRQAERAPTPGQYSEQIVLPTLHEFLATREDRRRAYLACVVNCHCGDTIVLAKAVADFGFADVWGRPRRRALHTATVAVQTEMRQQCGGMSPSNRWRDELQRGIGRHVSLELFSRPGEEQSEEEAARARAILLWTRAALRDTAS